jgi:hypothetical protein
MYLRYGTREPVHVFTGLQDISSSMSSDMIWLVLQACHLGLPLYP